MVNPLEVLSALPPSPYFSPAPVWDFHWLLSISQTYSPALVLQGLHGILLLAFHHGLLGECLLSMEQHLLWPWCVLCCFPVFLFPALLPVWHCDWLFLNYVSSKVPPLWPKSSALPCRGSFWSQMEPPVTGSGQPKPLLTKATSLPTHWHGHPLQPYSIKIFFKVGKEACSLTCTPNPHFCKIRLRKMCKLGFSWLFLGDWLLDSPGYDWTMSVGF